MIFQSNPPFTDYFPIKNLHVWVMSQFPGKVRSWRLLAQVRSAEEEFKRAKPGALGRTWTMKWAFGCIWVNFPVVRDVSKDFHQEYRISL